jgi:hypothetical protein
MKRFYFYGSVTYLETNGCNVPRGSLGLHYVDGDNEEELKRKYEEMHNEYNLHLIDMFGKTIKAPFKWYGENKNDKI